MNLPARFDHTFRIEVTIAVVVFGVITVAFLFAILRSFTRRGRQASQKPSYKKAEAVYVSVVAAAAAGIATLSLTENRTTYPRPALTVDVTGFQWCWRFTYEGTPVTVSGNCVDGGLPVLELPTGEPIAFHVRSNDVVHSMWIPALRFKLFAYPGFVNTFETTIPTAGRFDAECAEFCGQYHFAMHFTLVAVAPARFSSWMAQQQTAGTGTTS
ncbi:MAG TPA: hypothetical protein VKI19_05515 [Acidimicrobiales bacterium]|nr:hypothetical protein [Acidimicrobiales bacterium]